MESFDTLEGEISQTRLLLNKMEFTMRNQLEKEFSFDEENTQRHKKRDKYKDRDELNEELISLKGRLDEIQLEEDNNGLFTKEIPKDNEEIEFEKRRYQLEIRLLREELEKVKRKKGSLVKELSLIKAFKKKE